MPIKINVSMIDGGKSKPLASHTLDESRITIGRDQKCTLPLTDPKKFVSRMHAEIEEKGGTYWLKVDSKVNPVLVNGQRHESGASVALATGDLLTFGKYRLEILIPVEESAESSDATMFYRGAPDAAAGDLSDELTYVHRPTVKKMIPEHKDEPAPAPKKGLSTELTYIPLPEQEAIVEHKAKPASAPEKGPSVELTYIPLPEQEAIPAHKAAPAPEKGPSVELTYIPLPEPEAIPAHKAEPIPPAGEDMDAEITYVRPPAMKPAVLSDAEFELGADDGAKRALRAFFQGVGLHEMEVTDPEAFLRDSGEIVRAAVEGIILLLTTRALALEELGIAEPASATEHSGNPLESMSDPREAIAFLFDPGKRTSTTTDPIQAFGDACADLRAHEIALIEGMRAVALGAILSVDPIAFDRAQEKSLGTPGRSRKSKLWDLFVAYHNKLAHDTRDDFKTAFGHNMTSEYLAHIRRLRGGR